MAKENRGRPRKYPNATLVRLSTTIHPDLKSKIEKLAWLKKESMASVLTEILTESIDERLQEAKINVIKEIEESK